MIMSFHRTIEEVIEFAYSTPHDVHLHTSSSDNGTDYPHESLETSISIETAK